jgi:hypothetical protein
MAENLFSSIRGRPRVYPKEPCGGFAGGSAPVCGGFAGSATSESPQTQAKRPTPLPAFFGSFRLLSRYFARLRRQLAISGRTVQIGLFMRFLRLLRSLCGPKSRGVPAPGAGLACDPRPWDRGWSQRASRVALLVGLHERDLVLLGSRARGAPVVVGPPHEDEPRIGSRAKRPEHAHGLRSHGRRGCPIRSEAGARSPRRRGARDGLPQAVRSDVRDGREIAPLRPADPGVAVVNEKLG